MYARHVATLVLVVLLVAAATLPAVADPCGMVPPIYLGEATPITRVGAQRTYVFYKDGVETFVIRPGFSGRVDEFGMLIPFPEPPAIRKVPDDIFAHVTAAIDPPEIVIDLTPVPPAAAAPGADPGGGGLGGLRFDTVRVLRQEAVGMYEVAVLAAGSAQALKRWMDDHGYKYPQGMDAACNDYVALRWCFVAVKTKVGQSGGVRPRPGQRKVTSKLPTGSTFDGNVQAMGFRFKSDELVVPMRLSSFNAGELHNIVYLLTDGPRKIRAIPEEYVVRQISGGQLFKNVTELLPVRVINGRLEDVPDWRRQHLARQRDPGPKNGDARDLFAADLLAAGSGELSLPHEEKEKELLRIGERLGLRGGEIDRLNEQSLAEARAKTVERALEGVKQMTLTVVDGDFPRDLLGKQNLAFAEYTMPQRRNRAELYDANQQAPAGRRRGIRTTAPLPPRKPRPQDNDAPSAPAPAASRDNRPLWLAAALSATLVGVCLLLRRTPRRR